MVLTLKIALHRKVLLEHDFSLSQILAQYGRADVMANDVRA